MFRTFARRQRQRYAAFRRFVLAFYTRGFRDLFFQPQPLAPMFRAFVTAVAGYWRPSLRTRVLLALFFVLVRIQQRIPVATRLPGVGTGPALREAVVAGDVAGAKAGRTSP
jgi:hypothetical protein